ncbi:MAG TPA: carboxypeptidase-like regulatory domain-containing protein [Pyrinomonadaceae bacterium]|nr:carboxypeptidase regulatory-like domain-containing protein [Chloracidobacterium sp.]MBK7804673.1 carboxypeptidase regulatory-like domain-containing protein [Chloracidobacterium sp.]MBL0240594.1 carboxypeptidase regulatory-like domain-containing protein [Chloracidobacterium sp.]MBP9934620.1 carboxypeptidase regulatory-like domain-containing protein [Pyrinomonadaceae bacterium]HQX56853.1 carboxypeptidase-like regulatory domain-containing protein [Pyrinomonadaceae bacterium]
MRQLFNSRPEFEFETPKTGKTEIVPTDRTLARPDIIPLAPMPTPALTFNGMNLTANGAGWPPDTVGDVGVNHYIQAVNSSVRIFNKAGTTLSTFTFASLWAAAGSGTPCDTGNKGDPTVVHDPNTGRFVVADFAWSNTKDGPYYECVAVSKTSDPVVGGWWLYAIRSDDATHPWLPDYPKMGIWRDALYMGTNMFDCTNSSCSAATYQGARAYAFNFAKMAAGLTLTANDVQVVDMGSSRFTVIPANYRGTLPPPSTPAYFVGESGSLYAFEVFKFSVNFTTPALSTFSGPTNVTQSSYTVGSATSPVPAGGSGSIETLNERMMMQAQYRNISGVESVWVNHSTGTASTSTPVSIQWAQINVTGGTVVTTPVQQQIFNNGADGVNRFMGSLAVDRLGNMAIGYTAASLTLAPDIRYAGRLASDTPGTLPQSEVTLLPSVARSVQTTYTRWGDYSSMSVDPVDDCTFWYTNQYYAAVGTDWNTRVGKFVFPGCSSPTAGNVIVSGRVLLANGIGVSGASVTIASPDGSTRSVLSSPLGYYSFTGIESGQSYIVQVSSKRFSFTSRVLTVDNTIENLDFVAQ